MAVTSVKTEYTVEFDQSVFLTSEYRYDGVLNRDYVHEAVEVTGAIVSTNTKYVNDRAHVQMMGYKLTKAGKRSKRQKEAEWIGIQTILTHYSDGRQMTFDSSAYEALVEQAKAEAGVK